MIGMPWREQISLSRQAARDGVDILHSPCLTAPLRPACPSVVTIHDTIWLFPARYAAHGKRSAGRSLMRWYYRLVPRLAARRAATIITVSHASKEAIIQQLRIPPDRVFVTYEAASPLYRPASDRVHVAATLQKYGLVSDFILAIGSADPRKNLARLLEAYSLLPTQLQARCPLAIVWTHSHLARHISERAAALGIGQRLRFLKRVSNQDLAVLYGAARAFVFPSLYEGFGLPLLEAMSCGTPVIAADNSSIPEIAGDAALLVAADDASRMAEAITRVLVDVGLRGSLVERGLRRAGIFSWGRCAQETVGVYRKSVADLRQSRLGPSQSG